MTSNFTALYDACVLYPAPLRDLLMQLALTDLFRARWTDQIHDEWIRNVLKNRSDLTLKQLTRTREFMNSSVRDSLISDYEYLIASLELPDTDDRHILAAAIVGRVNVIITFNLKDFPKLILNRHNIEAQHPDDFISSLLDLSSPTVRDAAEVCRTRLKNPSKSIDEYLEILLKQGLTISVSMLQEL